MDWVKLANLSDKELAKTEEKLSETDEMEWAQEWTNPQDVHVTLRALEWLMSTEDPVKYKSDLGQVPCGKVPTYRLLKVADVRSLYVHKSPLALAVDCPLCERELKKALENSPRLKPLVKTP